MTAAGMTEAGAAGKGAERACYQCPLFSRARAGSRYGSRAALGRGTDGQHHGLGGHLLPAHRAAVPQRRVRVVLGAVVPAADLALLLVVLGARVIKEAEPPAGQFLQQRHAGLAALQAPANGDLVLGDLAPVQAEATPWLACGLVHEPRHPGKLIPVTLGRPEGTGQGVGLGGLGHLGVGRPEALRSAVVVERVGGGAWSRPAPSHPACRWS
jgi:hypothetical protein